MTIMFFTRTSGKKKNLYARLSMNGAVTELKLHYILDNNLNKLTLFKAKVEAEITELYNTQVINNRPADPQTIKALYLSDKNVRYFMVVFKDYIKTKLKPRVVTGDLHPATFQKYQCTYNHLEDFLACRQLNDINIRMVNAEFIDDFDSFIRQFNTHNSAINLLGVIKRVLNYAKNIKGYIDSNPLDSVSLTRKKTHPTVLNWQELEQIIKKEHMIERLERVRDVFLFQCFTGLSYSDMVRTKISNLEVDVFTINRKKNNEVAVVYLYQFAKDILRKYNGALPVISNVKLNAYLKELADICGIEKKLTTHVARHTYATTINLNNGVPMEVVQQLLGHSSIKQTQHYAKLNPNSILNSCKTVDMKLQKVYNSTQLSMFLSTLDTNVNPISSHQTPSHGQEKA